MVTTAAAALWQAWHDVFGAEMLLKDVINTES